MVKNGLNTLLATKILTRLELYAYFLQKGVHIEDTLMKLNVFCNKRWWIIRKILWNFGIVSKSNLIVNWCSMKNI